MSSVADVERKKAALEMTAPLLEPAEQKILVDEIVGRLQEQVANWVAEAAIQPGRVSAWRILFDAEWKAKPALDVLFHELRMETSRLAGKSPARVPLACPSRRPDGEVCTGYLVVERRLSEQVPLVGIEDAPAGPVYVEGVRSEIECDEAWVGICSQCDMTFAPEEYVALIAAASESREDALQ